MTIKAQIVLAFAILAAGIYAGSKLVKPVVQTVEIEKEVTRVDTVVVTHEIKRPDGTVETTTTATDKSQISKEDSKSVTIARKDWFVVASSTVDRTYGLAVNRRILGPVFLGVGYQTNGTVVGTVAMEF